MKKLLKNIVVSIITFEAHVVLKKYKPTVIIITGSVGKTSMKDAVGEVLGQHFFVRKSEKSYNSETGVPLTILGCTNPWNNYVLWAKVIWEGLLLMLFPNHYPKILVLEVGADKPGDVKSMMQWIVPDVVVVTKLPDIPVHVEAYASPDATREEEFSPAYSLGEQGVLIYNKDDRYAEELSKGIRAHVMSYGCSEDAQVRGEDPRIEYDAEGFPYGMSARVVHAGKLIPVEVSGALGKHQLYPVLGAIAVGITQGITLVDIVEALRRYIPPVGRMRLLHGIHNSLLIDDSYNASPVAVQAALETLKKLEVSGRRIVVLGDMLELGTYSIAEHEKVGRLAAKIADMLVTVGIRAEGIAEGAHKARLAKKNIHSFDTAKDAATFLSTEVTEGDVVFVKGSQGVRLERITEVLIQDKERAHELLVRQDKEWLQRN